MDRETKKKIQELKKQKKYDDIYVHYGTNAYMKNTPSKYKKEELKKLTKERKYFDIYNKYGENEYNKILVKAGMQEIKETKGSFQSFTWGVAQNVKRFLKKLGIDVTVGVSTIMLGVPTFVQSIINDNAVQYEKEIEAYDEEITRYAEQVRNLKLNHLQTIMKVMDDMWKNMARLCNSQKGHCWIF